MLADEVEQGARVALPTGQQGTVLSPLLRADGRVQVYAEGDIQWWLAADMRPLAGCLDVAAKLMPGWQQHAEHIVHGHQEHVCFSLELEGRTFTVQITEAL